MLRFWRLGSFVHLVVVGGVWTPSKIVSPDADTMSLIGEVVSVLTRLLLLLGGRCQICPRRHPRCRHHNLTRWAVDGLFVLLPIADDIKIYIKIYICSRSC